MDTLQKKKKEKNDNNILSVYKIMTNSSMLRESIKHFYSIAA